MKSQTTNSFNKASTIFALSIILGSVTYAWTGPGVGHTPANYNVSAPINVGTDPQIKNGVLWANNFAGGSLVSFGRVSAAHDGRPDVLTGYRAMLDAGNAADEGGQLILLNNEGKQSNIEAQGGSNPRVRIVSDGGEQFFVNHSGDVWANKSVTSPKFCIGSSCITSWPNTSGTVNLKLWTSGPLPPISDVIMCYVSDYPSPGEGKWFSAGGWGIFVSFLPSYYPNNYYLGGLSASSPICTKLIYI